MEVKEFEVWWKIPFKHSAGLHATKFFEGLKEGKILGVKCSKCGRVLVPPRAFCERCHVETTEWVEVADEGVLETLTVTYMKFTGLPDPPYAVGVVKLDGADTGMLLLPWWSGHIRLEKGSRSLQTRNES